MIFPADDFLSERPHPTPLYAAAAETSKANIWTSINGMAAARVYSSVEAEYNAAKTASAIADFGALARYSIRGKDAGALLTRIATAPALRLSPGECARGLLLDDAGGVIDLVEASRLTDELFLLTTSTPHPRIMQLSARGLDVSVENISSAVAVIGVIGKAAMAALSATGLSAPGDQKARSVVLRGVETAARPLQFGALPGAELIFPADEALTVWERLMRKAKSMPIGLDAMEILRIESGTPRPGLDFPIRAMRADEMRPTPSEIGLPHLAPLDSGWFGGRRALRFAPRPENWKLTVLAIDADRMTPGASIYCGENVAGRITSCVLSPGLRRIIAFARISPAMLGKGRDFSVAGDAGERHGAQLLETAEGALAAAFLDGK